MRQKTWPPQSAALKPLVRALARIIEEEHYRTACEEHRNAIAAAGDDMTHDERFAPIDRDGDERHAAIGMFADKSQMITDRYLRRNEVERITSLSRATIYRRMEQGSFPRPYKVGANTVRWRESDLRAWMSQHKLS